jgi:alanyl-tRNA synthetase
MITEKKSSRFVQRFEALESSRAADTERIVAQTVERTTTSLQLQRDNQISEAAAQPQQPPQQQQLKLERLLEASRAAHEAEMQELKDEMGELKAMLRQLVPAAPAPGL